MSRWFNLHNHSKFSALDGMGDVPTMVDIAADDGQPALALTDHGNLAGTFQLYKLAKAADIKPLPGIETYLVNDINDKDAQRYHAGLLALDYEGYKALVKLSSEAFKRPAFHRKPRIDFTVLAEMADAGVTEHLALTTGCYFGLPIQALVNEGPELAAHYIRTYASWFPNTYVEVQQHYTPHPDGWSDIDIAYELLDIADNLGLPVVTTMDCHYIEEDHKDTHTLMKRLTMHGADPGDVGFPGDTYHFARWREVKAHYADDEVMQEVWNRSLEGCDDIYAKSDLSIPALDTYQFRIPPVAATKRPVPKLRKLSVEALDALIGNGIPKSKRATYLARVEEELDDIKFTGFASYFLIVKEIVDYCHEQGIVVQARGSANGSLVCWLLGITSVDSIKWGIPFSTFLTRDRAKPPDIDLDIEKGRRAEVAGWCHKRYRTVQLGTWRKLATSDDDPEDEGKGSIWRSYMSAVSREHPKLANGKLGPADVAHKLGDYDNVIALDEMKVYSSPGTHAAGFLLDPGDGLLEEVVPTMLIASSDTVVTQVDMDDAEDAGFVKIDLLGLRTLSSLRRTLELMDTDWSFMETIPFSDSATYTLLSRGIPHSGIFQAEGYATAKGMRKLRPRNIREVIDAMALFRPATMQSGSTDRYLINRRDPARVVYVADVLEPHLDRTHGVFLYQEQVLGVARDLGLDALTVQRLLKAIKVKHGKKGASAASTRIFEESQEQFVQAGVDHGLAPREAQAVWSMIEGFQRYSFKIAHATPYGILAYRSAWLKHHHPSEFHAALLETIAWAQPKKEPEYLREVRRVRNEQHERGVRHPLRILPPHVNESGWSWTLNKETNAIREGLVSIKGVGMGAATAIADGAPWAGLQDMVDRLPAKVVTGGKTWSRTGDIDELGGTYKALLEAGALDDLSLDRFVRIARPKRRK